MKSSKKRSIFYLTFNGVYNNNNGIGTQTKSLLKCLEKHYVSLADEFGDFSVNIVTPVYSYSSTKDFSEVDIQYAQMVTALTGGEVIYCPYEYISSEFWNVNSWKVLSIGAATLILNLSKLYSENLVIAVDTPFLHTPIIIEKAKSTLNIDVKSLISLYSTSFFHDKKRLSARRLAWEYTGLTLSRQYGDIKIGQISDSHKEHLITNYGVTDVDFAPYASSLVIDSDEFVEMTDFEVLSVVRKYSIPTDRDLILAFGRASWIKGFDIILNEYRFLKTKPHLVLIAGSSHEGDGIIKEYRLLIEKNNIDCTLFTKFKRDLPRALSQFVNTKVVVCPSRGEPFSNIPLEVAVWARKQGPIIIASNLDGYLEQIHHGLNGFLFDINREGDLAANIDRILDMSPIEAERIRTSAYSRVKEERDFLVNFKETLRFFWTDT